MDKANTKTLIHAESVEGEQFIIEHDNLFHRGGCGLEAILS